MEHHTKEKGDIGFQAVSLDLTIKGYKVFTSNCEHLPFDLIAYKNKRMVRVQVKFRSINKKGLISIDNRTSWADKEGSHHRQYETGEIDYFAVYCPETDKCYYVSAETIGDKLTFSLRVELPLKQNISVNMADEFLEIITDS